MKDIKALIRGMTLQEKIAQTEVVLMEKGKKLHRKPGAALFSRPFRPIGFLDYTGERAWRVARVNQPPHAREKNVIVSFGSPYFGRQYFPRAKTYVNAYSMLGCSVEAFVRAACVEIPFTGTLPVALQWP